jgi:hypothetical protein
MSLQIQYAELLKLTQEHLLQEFKSDQRLYAESETYEYFRQQALRAKGLASPNKAQSPQSPQASITNITNNTPSNSQPQALLTSIPLTAASGHAPQKTPEVPKKMESPLAQTEFQTSISEQSSLEKPLEVTAKKFPSAKNFILEPLANTTPPHFNELRKAAEETSSHFKFLSEVPSDSNVHLSPETVSKRPITVAILSFNEPPKQHALLVNLARALEVYDEQLEIISAFKTEADNNWNSLLKNPSLRLVIASSHFMESCPLLHKYYRESAKQAKHYLGDKPLLLLSDISFYLKEPKLKLSLWEAIKALLK